MIYLPPLIAGFLGSDHIAALIATLPQENSKPEILIDIGTNTEISLMVDGKILSCSTASGPAFEGAQIQQGVRAANGAIEKISIHQDRVEYKSIGNAPPNGLCGTGILSAVSELLSAGMLNRSGSYNRDNPRLKIIRGMLAFPIVLKDSGINFSRHFCHREGHSPVQLAKGAIRTGIDILLKESKISAKMVNKWYIAGGFGTYLDISNAIRIGMVPEIDKNLVHQVGNAAGMGAKAMLLSRNMRNLAEKVASQANPIDLTLYPGFSDIYIDNLVFPDPDSLILTRLVNHFIQRITMIEEIIPGNIGWYHVIDGRDKSSLGKDRFYLTGKFSVDLLFCQAVISSYPPRPSSGGSGKPPSQQQHPCSQPLQMDKNRLPRPQ